MHQKIQLFRKLKKWIEEQHEKIQVDFLHSCTQTALTTSKAKKEILDDLADWISKN